MLPSSEDETSQRSLNQEFKHLRSWKSTNAQEKTASGPGPEGRAGGQERDLPLSRDLTKNAHRRTTVQMRAVSSLGDGDGLAGGVRGPGSASTERL